MSTTTNPTLEALELIQLLSTDISDLLSVAAEDADVTLSLHSNRRGSAEYLLSEALVQRLVHSEDWIFTSLRGSDVLTEERVTELLTNECATALDETDVQNVVATLRGYLAEAPR